MVRKKTATKSSLLAKYTLQYQKKPKSRVFAPLAETYRKLGMYDEALKILREGMKFHPAYTLAYIVLAHIYYDQQNYELAYNTVRPFVTDNLENITLQKLFARICINLGYLEEALQTFKYLLLINPKDQYVSEQVKLLEDDLLVKEENEEEAGFVEKRMSSFNDDGDWIQVDFGRGRRLSDVNEADMWDMKKDQSPLEKFKEDIDQSKLDVPKADLEDIYYHEDYDDEEDATEAEEVKTDPIITHTLVDLYCKQGHFDKALDILDSILKLHPEDSATEKRAEEIRELINSQAKLTDDSIRRIEKVDLDEIPDDEQLQQESSELESGHEELLQLIESKKEKDKELLLVVKGKLENFSDAIRLEATRRQLDL